MASDAEIDAAVKAMRAVRTVGGNIHEEVLRAYARAALEAAERVQIEAYQKRAELRQRQGAANPQAGTNGGQA
jgi:hypothetical protein